MPRRPWEFDVFTALNATFDAASIFLCLYLVVQRIRPHLHAKRQPATHAQNAVPQVQSLWSRKRPHLAVFTATVTALWHLVRVLLVLFLSFNAMRIEHAEQTSDPASLDDIDATQNLEDQRLSALVRPPAIWGVKVLPVLMVLSRAGIIALFAFPRKLSPPSVPESTEPVTPGSPSSPRMAKMSVASKRGEPPSSTPALPSDIPSSPVWEFVRTIPGRVYGPSQNLYLVAFYLWLAYAAVAVPFTYHPLWYFDTPRLEPITSLYLASFLKDASRVKGLSVKDKVRRYRLVDLNGTLTPLQRQRGIVSFQRVVYIRWAALLVMALGFPVEVGWRLGLEGSVMYILWRIEI